MRIESHADAGAATKHTPEMLEAMQRAAYVLDAARRFINTNPIEEYTVIYDEAKCDGACLADDCKIAADELRLMIAKAEGGQ